MIDIFRKRTKTDNTRKSFWKIVHYGSKKFVSVGLKTLDLAWQKIKGSENINISKSNIKLWKLENFPCCSCKLYLWHVPRLLHLCFILNDFMVYVHLACMNYLFQYTYFFKVSLSLRLNQCYKMLCRWTLQVLITWKIVDFYYCFIIL